MTLFDRFRPRFDRFTALIALALVLLLAGLFLPELEVPRRVYDSIVIFDISQSMGVEDYARDGTPVSRLTYARESARQALRELPCGSRVGWGAFTEYRAMLLLAPVEVCRNYADLLASLERIDGRMRWAEASEITKGVYWSIRAAKATDSRPAVIFVTDGHEAPPLDPTYQPPMFEDIEPGEVHGWLLGAGGETPAPIPRTDDEGRPLGYWRATDVIQSAGGLPTGSAPPRMEHLSGLRESHLQTIARQVGFAYGRLAAPSAISAAMRDPKLARRRPVATDLAWLPAAGAFLLLLFAFRPDFSNGFPRNRR